MRFWNTSLPRGSYRSQPGARSQTQPIDRRSRCQMGNFSGLSQPQSRTSWEAEGALLPETAGREVSAGVGASLGVVSRRFLASSSRHPGIVDATADSGLIVQGDSASADGSENEDRGRQSVFVARPPAGRHVFLRWKTLHTVTQPASAVSEFSNFPCVALPNGAHIWLVVCEALSTHKP